MQAFSRASFSRTSLKGEVPITIYFVCHKIFVSQMSHGGLQEFPTFLTLYFDGSILSFTEEAIIGHKRKCIHCIWQFLGCNRLP